MIKYRIFRLGCGDECVGAILLRRKREGIGADIVYRQAESGRFLVFALASHDVPNQFHARLVLELNVRQVVVVVAVCAFFGLKQQPVVDKAMPVFDDTHFVYADRYIDSECSIGLGPHGLSVCLHEPAVVHFKFAVFYRKRSAFIDYRSAYYERGYVRKVDAVVYG